MGCIERSLATVLGLDLGQASDFTALVVDEYVKVISKVYPAYDTTTETGHFKHVPERSDGFCEHRIRGITRFPLRTSYPQIVIEVGKIIAALKAQDRRVVLVIDAGGVGRPVVELFHIARYGIPIRPVTITGGHHAKPDPESPGYWTVPKKDLVGVLQSNFHQKRLKIAQSLPLTKVFFDELINFRAKVTDAANWQFEAWRVGDHDDVVLAAAFAVWGAERFSNPGGLI